MHNYKRSRSKTIYSNLFKKLIGFVHKRMGGWGKEQLLSQVSKIWKKSEFFGKRQKTFGQNQNFWTATRIYLRKKNFCATKTIQI